ncbi:MAG: flagellar biosynthesis protein FlhB [Phycisphaeraceae bacterium]|nr:flagellar biosynthesis protein FlhB [Phycisphaeraceae bacterium]|tara:strand:+ start:1962 stop:3032 length:1071 start_codon:yes stop_codon:yes gene_type:complete
MADNDYERTEAPTPKRRQEQREEGNVARSTDLTAAIMLLASMALLYLVGGHTMQGMLQIMKRGLAFDPMINSTIPDDITELFALSGRSALELVAPFMIGISLVAAVGTIGQVGFFLTGKPLVPNISRLSPFKGIKNLVGIRAFVRLVMNLGKLFLLAIVATIAIAYDLPGIVMLAQLEPSSLMVAISGLVLSLGVKLAVLLLLLALLDYAYQRFQHERDIRMTKQQVKDEMKRMEGDPLMRQRRSRVARQLSMQRIGHAVPNADVVVTNPTHFAVALRYDSHSMKAPKLTAKGADFMAFRIRQLAIGHGIPIVERKELAQAVYRTVEVGQEVPPQYYNAVAEILAYVYRLSGRKTA